MEELNQGYNMDEVANVIMSEVDEKTCFRVKKIVLERKFMKGGGEDE